MIFSWIFWCHFQTVGLLFEFILFHNIFNNANLSPWKVRSQTTEKKVQICEFKLIDYIFAILFFYVFSILFEQSTEIKFPNFSKRNENISIVLIETIIDINLRNTMYVLYCTEKIYKVFWYPAFTDAEGYFLAIIFVLFIQ